MNKTLVAFYSRAGENYFGGSMRMLEVGNTEVAAKMIKDLTDADIFNLAIQTIWGTMPMAVFTFLESLDFAGKTIKPFCTHEGSGMGSSEADIKRLCPTAKVASGLAIKGSKVNSARENIENGYNYRKGIA